MTDKEILIKVREKVEKLKKDLPKNRGYKRNAYNHVLSIIDSMQKELVEESKKCMYSKDDYSDEDRKALCDGCKEECKFNKKEYSVNNGLDLGCGVIWRDEEPVSEDLEEEIGNYIENNFFGSETMGFFSNKTKEELNDKDVADIARHFANWQKQQMMAKAVDGVVKIDAGGYPYIPQMELYDYDKDIPLAKEGEKVKVIVIKED